MKKCSKCKLEKDITDFRKNSSKKDGLSTECKECIHEYNKLYRERKIKEIGSSKLYYRKKNKKKYAIDFSKYGGEKEYYKYIYQKYQKGNYKDSRAAWVSRNKDKLSEYNKKWISENKERSKELQRVWKKKNRRGVRRFGKPMTQSEYTKELFNSCPETKLRQIARVHLRRYLSGKFSSYEEIVGATPSEVKSYLESLFQEGMSWSNHGEWHIDHIIPLSSAKTENELLALNRFTNLQPLWGRDNLAKGNRVT